MNIKLGFVGLMLAFFSGLTIHGQNASEFINPDDHKVITNGSFIIIVIQKMNTVLLDQLIVFLT